MSRTFTKDGVSLGGNVFFEEYDSSKSNTSAAYGRTSYGGNLTLGFPVNENNSYYLGVGYTYNKLKNIAPEYNRDLYRQSMKYNDSWTFKSHDFDLSLVGIITVLTVAISQPKGYVPILVDE